MHFQGEQVTEISNGHVTSGEGVDPLADEFWPDPSETAKADLVDMMLVVDSRRWLADHLQAIRRAGRRGTLEGRRGSFDHYEDRKPGFVGRYDGPARIIPRVVAAEEGPEVAALIT